MDTTVSLIKKCSTSSLFTASIEANRLRNASKFLADCFPTTLPKRPNAPRLQSAVLCQRNCKILKNVNCLSSVDPTSTLHRRSAQTKPWLSEYLRKTYVFHFFTRYPVQLMTTITLYGSVQSYGSTSVIYEARWRNGFSRLNSRRKLETVNK